MPTLNEILFPVFQMPSGIRRVSWKKRLELHESRTRERVEIRRRAAGRKCIFRGSWLLQVVETGQVILSDPVVKLTFMFSNIGKLLQFFGYSPGIIFFDEEQYVLQRDGKKCWGLSVYEYHISCWKISVFWWVASPALVFKTISLFGEFFQGIDICVELIIEAAFKFPALSGKFLRD